MRRMDHTSRSRLDAFLRFVTDNAVTANELREIIPALTGQAPSQSGADEPFQSSSSPPAFQGAPMAQTQAGGDVKKLTVGMATYDDYDGVYFTLQAIRLYHREAL